MPHMWVRLERDSLEAIVAPAVGGGLAAFRVGGRDVLRAAPADAADPLALGEFPMAPYVNRIAHGRFRWRDETIMLPRNFGDHPHPLHGIAWRRAWRSVQESAAAARLMLEAPASADWPWAIRVERTVQLTVNALEIVSALTNADTRPMPASLGLHPYFPAHGARLRLRAQAQWLTAADGIPTEVARTQAVDALATGADVSKLALDHCFAGWDGIAEIAWPDLALRIETEPAQHFVQVYTPAGAPHFCVEPQSAMPDALNRDGGVVDLAPHQTLAFTTRLLLV
jgi:aldose 1-epimerase